MKPLTNQYRCFVFLQASGGSLTATQVADGTELTVEQAESALHKLSHAGKARPTGARGKPWSWVALAGAVVAPSRIGGHCGPRRPKTEARQIRLQQRGDAAARKHWPMPPCALAEILTPRLDQQTEAA